MDAQLSYYPFHKVTEELVQQLIDQRLYDEDFVADNTGLLRKYTDYLEDEGNPFQLIVTYATQDEILGVCVVLGHPSINVYVKPEFRRQGIASHLLTAVCPLSPKASGVYTSTSTALYKKFGIPDITLL